MVLPTKNEVFEFLKTNTRQNNKKTNPCFSHPAVNRYIEADTQKQQESMVYNWTSGIHKGFSHSFFFPKKPPSRSGRPSNSRVQLIEWGLKKNFAARRNSEHLRCRTNRESALFIQSLGISSQLSG